MLLLDLFHANLIELFNLKYRAFLLLLSVLSGLLGLHLGFLVMHNGRVMVLLLNHILHVEYLTQSDILGVIFQSGAGFLGFLLRDAAEYVLCLVHAALRSLLLVLLVSQMDATGRSIGPPLLLLVLLEPESLCHAVLDYSLGVLLLLSLLLKLSADEIVLLNLSAREILGFLSSTHLLEALLHHLVHNT